MKTVGLVGGTGWVSTIDYYRYMNQLVFEKTAQQSTAKVLVHSVNYPPIAALTAANKWDEIAIIISNAAKGLVTAGADCILLCANTMHHIAPHVAGTIDVPLIHIAEVTAKAIQEQTINKVALLGTKYTMNLPFFKDILFEMGIETLVPDEEDRILINDSIYKELSLGIVTDATKNMYATIIEKMTAKGAAGIIAGCTEIPMVVQQSDFDIPIFDTTYLHAQAAVKFALS
ncbi:aspartate/glutamate racemase family protein [Ferruginibacter yonginensis]|uniref:Aspartate/glutamate racemase family protein n=1 Tax=Ferruginibacter yonginensis TaxID=1310416 RepID=A0ABV8QPQ0_9BACT